MNKIFESVYYNECLERIHDLSSFIKFAEDDAEGKYFRDLLNEKFNEIYSEMKAYQRRRWLTKKSNVIESELPTVPF